MSHTIQMIHKTAIDGMGIFQLGMVPDFFKKMKIPIFDIKVKGVEIQFGSVSKSKFPQRIYKDQFQVQIFSLIRKCCETVAKLNKIS